MREITDHHDHGLAKSLHIMADEPGLNGASHKYQVFTRSTSPLDADYLVAEIQYEVGSAPGIRDSVLLAIVIDRMRAFESGPYPCRENALILTKCEEALYWLRHRADRLSERGVPKGNEK